MHNYEILTYPEPILNQVARELLETEIRDGVTVDGHNLSHIVSEMTRLMRMTDRGIGLSAPQVGMPIRLFIIDATQRKTEPLVFLNPVLSDFAGRKIKLNEGCLSLPGINAHVERREIVTVTARRVDGTTFGMVLQEMMARVAQHENDHLNGITIMRHAGSVARWAAAKHLDRMQRMYDHRKLVESIIAARKATAHAKKVAKTVSDYDLKEAEKRLEAHADEKGVDLKKLLADVEYKPELNVVAKPVDPPYDQPNYGGDVFPLQDVAKAMETLK